MRKLSRYGHFKKSTFISLAELTLKNFINKIIIIQDRPAPINAPIKNSLIKKLSKEWSPRHIIRKASKIAIPLLKGE